MQHCIWRFFRTAGSFYEFIVSVVLDADSFKAENIFFIINNFWQIQKMIFLLLDENRVTKTFFSPSYLVGGNVFVNDEVKLEVKASQVELTQWVNWNLILCHTIDLCDDCWVTDASFIFIGWFEILSGSAGNFLINDP